MKWIVLSFLGAVAMAAQAQVGSYPVRSLDFDIWCTEEEHLPADRCDQRLPEDMQKFEAYRAIIERYELPYLQRKEQELRFNHDILHNDPLDNSVQQQAQPPQATDGKSP
jgi:hypothetical protein